MNPFYRKTRSAEGGLLPALRTAGRGAETGAERIDGLDIDLGPPIRAGMRVIVFGFVAFFAAAALISIDAATLAHGVFAVETRRKPVQHLEGGIVDTVLVSDGDAVEAGDLLIRLVSRQVTARTAQLGTRIGALVAEQARIEAELSGEPIFSVAPDGAEGADAAALDRAVALQGELLESRTLERRHKASGLESRAAQAVAEVDALTARLAGQEERLTLLDERLDGMRSLARDGHVSRAQLSQIEAERAALEAERGDIEARIAAGRHAHAQALEELASFEGAWRARLSERLQELERELAETRENLGAAEDVVARTEIRAPTAGEVQQLVVHGQGAVVEAGATLLEIVPDADALVVEAEIRTEDIENVHRGQLVDIRPTAFGFRSTQPIRGEVVEVSADRIVDERGGRAFYRVVARLDSAAEALPLRPGMPADVMLLQGRRTMLDYLSAPIVDVLRRAFRE